MTDNRSEHGSGRKFPIVPIIIAILVVLFIGLHLAGVFGPGSH